MSTSYITNRPINLAQLTAELDGAALSSATVGDEITVTAHGGVPTAKLQAAVDAHVPADPPPSDVALLQQQVNELTDLIIFGF